MYLLPGKCEQVSLLRVSTNFGFNVLLQVCVQEMEAMYI